jgi:hypothetical protein
MYSVAGAAATGGKRRAMLTTKQSRLIAALVTCATVRGACRRARVGDRSYRDWKGQPEFASALKAAREALLRDGLGTLGARVPAAVRVLGRLLKSPKDSIKLRAATTIVDRGIRGCEFADLVDRIEALEALEKARKGRR